VTLVGEEVRDLWGRGRSETYKILRSFTEMEVWGGVNRCDSWIAALLLTGSFVVLPCTYNSFAVLVNYLENG
jgi:hypothetical protein